MCIFKIDLLFWLRCFSTPALNSTSKGTVYSLIKKMLQLDKLFSSGNQKVNTALAQIKATMVISE